MAAPSTACPTAVVDAPIETVWNLLTNLAGWGDFYNVRVTSVEPPGTAVVGQQMRAESGPRWLHLGRAHTRPGRFPVALEARRGTSEWSGAVSNL
jgi:hypothetical protein